MFRVWLLAFVLISSSQVVASGQQIRGAIVDPNGASVAGASVRLLGLRTGAAADVTADESGKFQIGIGIPDNYVLKAWRQGFRNRRVPVVVSTEAVTIDLGNIRLDVAGCDAPGIFCDWFGEAPPLNLVISEGYLRAQTGCLLALTRNKVFCPSDPKGGHGEADADIRITRDENGVYLTAMNGAALSAPDLVAGDCRDAHPKERKIRIDGFGSGDDICIYTHDRRRSHVFLTDEVSRDSDRIAVWQITRKR
jgi:Carboxypeptidase regulatory-like domain